MGGYCFDMTQSGQQRLPFMLDNFGVLIPYLSIKEISGKSRANYLAKGIICVQAIWFCARLFGRISQWLSVTILKLITFAHSICALLIYLL